MLWELVTARYQAWRDDSEHEDRLEYNTEYKPTGTRSVGVGKDEGREKMEDRQI